MSRSLQFVLLVIGCLIARPDRSEACQYIKYRWKIVGSPGIDATLDCCVTGRCLKTSPDPRAPYVVKVEYDAFNCESDAKISSNATLQ